MKNTDSTPKMKWYNYLTYFWLPLFTFFCTVLLIVELRMYAPLIAALCSPKFEIDLSKLRDLFIVLYSMLFLCVLPLIYTMIVKRSLKKFAPLAPKLLSFWYVLPILLNLGFVSLLIFWDDPSAGSLIGITLAQTLFLIVRALIVMPYNSLYFLKRAELFVKKPVEEIVVVPVEEPKKKSRKERRKERQEARKEARQEARNKKRQAKQPVEAPVEVPAQEIVEVPVEVPEKKSKKELKKESKKARKENRKKKHQEEPVEEPVKVRQIILRTNRLEPLMQQFYE